MSATGDILDRFLVDVAAGITGTVTTHRGFRPIEKVPAGADPYAMTFASAGATDQSEDGHRVEIQTFTFACLIYGRQRTQVVLETWLDEVQTKLATDRTLNGLVEWCSITDWEFSNHAEIDDTEVADRAVGLGVAAERIV